MTEPRYPYVHVDAKAEEVELFSAELFALGAAGVEERDATTLLQAEGGDSTLVASFADEASAVRALEAFADRGASLHFVEGDDWADAWREYFHPMRIGERLLLRPSFREVSPEPDVVVLTIDPGRAFGSGIHETTRLVLREVEARVRGGERVLDVGCGSGVLSVAALLLGAEHATCVDVDAAAVEVSLENARLNGVEERLDASTTDVRELAGAYPLVLANIQSVILIGMADALMARVAPGGCLVLSGILVEQERETLAAFTGLEHVGTQREGEWLAPVLIRPRDDA
ncbi:MAG: 50S ribosomal protein L11 methyltransferase [Deltaproteobacteria bacterium]|nr:50S ribosomal protein L11 methyltransferase [Deltaproteobacteria bacterium]